MHIFSHQGKQQAIFHKIIFSSSGLIEAWRSRGRLQHFRRYDIIRLLRFRDSNMWVSPNFSKIKIMNSSSDIFACELPYLIYQKQRVLDSRHFHTGKPKPTCSAAKNNIILLLCFMYVAGISVKSVILSFSLFFSE